MKFYIDTSVWRDYFEDRKDNLRPLGQFAFEFLAKIKRNKDRVVYSELIIKELLNVFNKDVITEIFKILKEDELLDEIKIRKKHLTEAEKISKQLNVHLSDCVHAVLCKSSRAILVTRDKHFYLLEGIIKVKRPEQLL